MRADGWMRIVTPHHRKFRTAPGYIGIAPWIAQLHNAPRGVEPPSHNMHAKCAYSFISDGYAHGLIDGEALALVKSGSLTQKVVVLGGEGFGGAGCEYGKE
ncbi:hypothetical protein HBH70_101310 [Parastagonospora nodorum]|nr:hypothetical protein HBH51_171000 [Parastagonospora nodorum]KAH3991801.1 hypothetical protein HBI10_225760 [Parastagonospora nodorum]KAH4402225.1 hypothetical protein HBH92_212860 [Parastagonospora nodorum]KAH4431633.1 hypothetical protein HBH91_228150 [Parastagonospora nodorum]KAH4484619.1 hypothetical protein HBH89_223100 [Parastagonospora nodorum]